MLNSDKAKLYEEGAKSKRKGNYASNDHKRYRRGLFRIPYGKHIFVFYPARFWPAYTGLSVSGMRSLVESNIIVMYKRHGLDVATRGELEIIKQAAEEHKVTFRQQARDNPQFVAAVRKNLNLFRTCMDHIKVSQQPNYPAPLFETCMSLNLNDRNSTKE